MRGKRNGSGEGSRGFGGREGRCEDYRNGIGMGGGRREKIARGR